MLPVMGALLSGGASLLSGLFGRSGAKKQAKKEEDAIREANRVAQENADIMNISARARADAAALVPRQMSRGVDVEGFMDAAERMGFNPLTFLRSGALSAFEWTCDTGAGAMQAAEAGQYIPQLAPVLAQTKVPSMGEVFGNALVSGANQYLAGAEQQNRFQQDVMLAQLRGAQSFGAYSGMRSFSTPQASIRSRTAPTVSSDPSIWDLLVGETADEHGRKLPNMYRQVVDNSTGKAIWIPDQDVVPDNDVLGAALALTGGSWTQKLLEYLPGTRVVRTGVGANFRPVRTSNPVTRKPLGRVSVQMPARR